MQEEQEKELNQNLGNRISKIRKSLKMSQELLAEKAGISSDFLSRVERGVCGISVSNLHAIARSLNTSLKDLFDFEEKSEHQEFWKAFSFKAKDPWEEQFKNLCLLLRKQDAETLNRIYRQTTILLERNRSPSFKIQS